MQGILLDRQVAVWRKVQQAPGQYVDTQVYATIRCAIVPISKLDQVSAAAYESSHLLWFDHWLAGFLRKEDEIRDGRRPPDAEGDVLQWQYVINGRREFRLGIPQIAFYAKELD